MPVFPMIQSPCPYKGSLSDIMDGEICRLCKREVVDLLAFSDSERVAFLESCSDEICVTYKFPLRAAVAATIAAAALAAPMAAAAQDFEVDEQVIVVGGITDRANIEYVSDESPAPELPVVYADEATANDEQPGEETSTPATDLSHSVEAQ